VQLIEDFTIFSVTCNVSCPRAVNFELKLMLNLDKSVQQFRERQRMRSFRLRTLFFIYERVLFRFLLMIIFHWLMNKLKDSLITDKDPVRDE
jgi:hypothetical protein